MGNVSWDKGGKDFPLADIRKTLFQSKREREGGRGRTKGEREGGKQERMWQVLGMVKH